MTDSPGPAPGTYAEVRHVIENADTARAVGSGALDVLATPRLLAWCEQAACAAIEPTLTPGSTSVGTRVRLDHLGASGVGASITTRATVTSVDGRLLQFEVVAVDGDGRVVGQGDVRRVVVDVERFLARVPPAG